MITLALIGAWHNSLDRMPTVILVSPLSNYFIFRNGEWVSIESLPSKYPWGSVEVVNNRLLYIGGSDLATSTSNRVFIHNEETGWHLSNMEIQVSRSRHVSSVVIASEINQSYPGIYLVNIIYRTRAIITHGLYIFYPIFQFGL